MSQADDKLSTLNITPKLVSQIIDSLKNKAYGSVEIYIQNYNITQITERTITKVNTYSVRRKKSANGYQKNNRQSSSESVINRSLNSGN